MKRVVLDVLKPHDPKALEFAQALAKVGPDYRVKLTVIEMDENTETLLIEVSGNDIDVAELQSAIEQLGGSLHSIDEVEVQGDPD